MVKSIITKPVRWGNRPAPTEGPTNPRPPQKEESLWDLGTTIGPRGLGRFFAALTSFSPFRFDFIIK